MGVAVEGGWYSEMGRWRENGGREEIGEVEEER